jgi:predicted transcriptional regulator
MAEMKGEGMTQDQLFQKACVSSKTTGKKALNELLSAGLIQRVGKGSKGNLFWYFRKAQPHSLLLIRLFGLLRQSARAC